MEFLEQIYGIVYGWNYVCRWNWSPQCNGFNQRKWITRTNSHMDRFHPSRMKLTQKRIKLRLEDESDDLGSRKRTIWMKRSAFNENDTTESILHDWNSMTMHKANQMMKFHNKDEIHICRWNQRSSTFSQHLKIPPMISNQKNLRTYDFFH